MDEEHKTEILARSFDIMDEIVDKCVSKADEATTREAIKNEINERLKNTDDPDERYAIMEAYQHLSAFSYEELLELADIAYVDEEDQEFLREKLFRHSNFLETIILPNENGAKGLFQIFDKFVYNDKIYVILIDMNDVDFNLDHSSYVYEFIMGDTMEEDQLVKVTDPALEQELREYHRNKRNEEGGGDDDD